MIDKTGIVGDNIRSRRSIDSYKQQLVPIEVIRDAIDFAVWAPNHRMSEPWRFYLLGPKTKEQVCELNANIVSQQRGEDVGKNKFDKWMAIPGWLVVSCQNSDSQIQWQEDYAACACTIHNLSLVLWSQGIGMKWTTGNITRDDVFYELTWIDRAVETVVGLIWYGYPDEIPISTRRPAEELTLVLD